MSDREEFLTAKQIAEILQVSESTVRRMAQKRRIPSVRLTPRIIRFHLDAVREATLLNVGASLRSFAKTSAPSALTILIITLPYFLTKVFSVGVPPDQDGQ